jgi:hypothetical protein
MTRGLGAAVWVLFVTMLPAAIACRRGTEAAHLTELQRVKSGTLDIVLLSDHDALRHGKDTFVIDFKSASNGNLVDVGTVRASANMPMPGMPMFGSIDVTRTDVPGRYASNGQFDMAGTWRMTVEWDGPAGHGSVSFPGTVQ